MNREVVRYLQKYYISWFVLCILLVVLFETGVFMEGVAVGEKSTEYILSNYLIVSTLLSVPLVLKLPVLPVVMRRLARSDGEGERNYKKMSLLRITWLGIILLQEIIGYYLFMAAAFFYLGLIVVVALFFVWPSQKQIDMDMEKARGQAD